jgi:L-fuconolactonase
MPIIDAHHHFWRFNVEEYGWMGEPMQAIQRDFLPEDLKREIKAAGVDGVVTVQARQKTEETRWLLELAGQHDFLRGVVGWVPLIDAKIRNVLEAFADYPKLRGVRHVLHDEADERYMLREDFNRGIAALQSFGLAYDILIFERHLPHTIAFVDQHPKQVFVLDHVAKPRIKENLLEPWAKNMRELARRPNVFCKISAMVTEADWAKWTEPQLRPYFTTVLEAFGPARLMLGTDWPVCLVACGYKQWVNTVHGWVKELSATEQAQILGETAAKAYRL